MLGTQDLLIGLVLAAFFFGAKRLPELARSLGDSMTEFKKAVSGDEGNRTADDATGTLPVAASNTATARTCPGCKTALEPDWAHCPRCGTATSPPPMSDAR
jgi:TatA/E family protein of Tat protein translocase